MHSQSLTLMQLVKFVSIWKLVSQYATEQRDELVTIVVGGAGFTGIEYVGELANRVPELCKEYNVPREKHVSSV